MAEAACWQCSRYRRITAWRILGGSVATYKSTMRSLQATARRYERDAARRQRELERQQREAEKLEAQEHAAHEVAVFENYLDVMTSLHLDVGPELDWEKIVESPPPAPPPPVQHRQAKAQAELDAYRPSKLMKKRGAERLAELEAVVVNAAAADADEYREAIARHDEEREEHADLVALAQGVLAGDPDAYRTVLLQMSDLFELAELGERLRFAVVSPDCVAVNLDAHSDHVIPTQHKSLLASGKLSEKAMPVGRRWELYQDHVCSAALRAARDIFALLPVKMAVVTVLDQILNGATGYKEEQPILSAAIPRATIDSLNMQAIDPSDSMANFVHNMTFQKTKGFKPCEALDLASFA